MPISQLTAPCWVLAEPSGGGSLVPDGAGDQHWETPQDARRSTDGPLRQLDEPCWVIQCDGDCEALLDLEDENCIFHEASRAEAERTAAAYYKWTVTPGGGVLCPEDGRPGDA